MKKEMFLLCIVAMAASMTGCAGTKVYTATRERVDISVSGNQGVIYGAVPAPHVVENATREVCSFDIELPTTDELKAAVKKEPGQKPAEKIK